MIPVVVMVSNLIFRRGLQKLWEGSEIKIVGEAHTGKKGLEQVRQYQPPVVLLEDQLPDMTGVSVCEMLHRHFPLIRVVFLVDQTHLPTFSRLLTTPALGLLTKQACERSAEAIKTVYEGGTYLQPDLALDILHYCIDKNQNPIEKLTQREHEVLTWIAQGKTYEWIAEHVHLGLKSVYNIKLKAYKKLGIQNREQLEILLSVN